MARSSSPQPASRATQRPSWRSTGRCAAIAVLLAAGGIAWLLMATIPTGGACQLIGLTLYGAGLVGMFVASAAYNSCGPCGTKELLRRVDHAMIFVMMAPVPARRSRYPLLLKALVC